MQIQHYYQNEVKRQSTEDQSGVTQMFMRAYNSEPTRQITGNLYSSISMMKNYSTDYIKQKWERELGIVISPEEWSAIIHAQTSTTNSELEKLLLGEFGEVFHNPKNKIKSKWSSEPMLETMWTINGRPHPHFLVLLHLAAFLGSGTGCNEEDLGFWH